MQYTKLHSAWGRLAILVSAGFVVVLPAADLALTSVFEPGGFGDQRTTAYTAGVTWDPPRPGTTTSNSDGLVPMQKRRSAAGTPTAANRPPRGRLRSGPRRRYGSFRHLLRTGFPRQVSARTTSCRARSASAAGRWFMERLKQELAEPRKENASLDQSPQHRPQAASDHSIFIRSRGDTAASVGILKGSPVHPDIAAEGR
jgi:hypothetical protein